MSAANDRLYACSSEPCAECLDVLPRRAYPAPPHGDVRRPVDILLVGLNPQLRDYRIRCSSCGHKSLVRHFEPTGWKEESGHALVCPACRSTFPDNEASFVTPTLEEWTHEGLHLDATGRGWISKRMDIDAAANIVNARLCWWPSRGEQTISFGGTALGTHLRELITECRPRVVVAYNKQAAEHLQGYADNAEQHQRRFVTSGGKKTYMASWIVPGAFETTDGLRFGLISLSQAQTAPHSLDSDGKTMRCWAGDTARAWIRETPPR